MTFEVGKTYYSSVERRLFHVMMKFRVQDTDCMMVRLDTIDFRTCLQYPAIIEDDGKTATVQMEEEFTTMYDEEVKIKIGYLSGLVRTYAVISDGYTLEALCRTEDVAKQCAGNLEEVVGDHCEVVPWEV